MTRAYSIYVAMFLVLGLGLAAVLHCGAGMHAPADLSGDWQVAWHDPAPAGRVPEDHLRIEQSGRHLVLHFRAGRRLSMKIESGSALGDLEAPAIAELQGEGTSIVLTRGSESGTLELSLRELSLHERSLRERSTHTALLRRTTAAAAR